MMPRAPLPVVKCESRRKHPFERGWLKWSFALLIVGGAAADGLWTTRRTERPTSAHGECDRHHRYAADREVERLRREVQQMEGEVEATPQRTVDRAPRWSPEDEGKWLNRHRAQPHQPTCPPNQPLC